MISSGLAKKIEEYVPTTIPTVKVMARIFVLAGPNMISEIKTRIVVMEVKSDRG